MQTFGCSRSMHHVVEMVSAELAFQSFGIAQIKLHETNALVLEVFFGAAFPYGRPHFHASVKRFFYDKAPDKPACTCNKYFVHSR